MNSVPNKEEVSVGFFFQVSELGVFQLEASLSLKDNIIYFFLQERYLEILFALEICFLNHTVMPLHLLNTIKFLPSDNEWLFAAEKGEWFGMSEKRVYMRGCQVCTKWKRNLGILVLSVSSGRAED